MSDFAPNAGFDAPTGLDGSGVAKFGAETQVFALFRRGTKRDNFASQEAGYPIEKGVDYVEIRQFGEKDSTIREVTPADKARWHQQWAAYKANQEQTQDGTPLDMLFPKSPEVVATLKANNIHTIQALAEIPDSTTLPFVGTHKQRAKQFLDGIGKGKGFHALEKKLEDSELRNMELEDRIKALEAAMTKSKKTET